VHAEQDALNKGHHQLHHHHGPHLEKQIFGSHHHLQYDCYQEAGMWLMAYYLSLLQVHQVHAKQDTLNEGHHQHHCSLQVLFALK
jgi:hypothetical protein